MEAARPTRAGSALSSRGGRAVSGQELLDFRNEGVGPDLVAFGVGVEEVGHDFFGENAVLVEEEGVHVFVGDEVHLGGEG